MTFKYHEVMLMINKKTRMTRIKYLKSAVTDLNSWQLATTKDVLYYRVLIRNQQTTVGV